MRCPQGPPGREAQVAEPPPEAASSPFPSQVCSLPYEMNVGAALQ